ncbi:hypothetical protein DSS3PM1_00095 [Bacteriophage DSS3_PM1]|nr:hypothetical protein DSS3PM1_00095 [Bacteriophage DSS3_PM1]
MSDFINKTNQGRVKKMVELVGYMEKSAANNDATPEDWQELLEPILALLKTKVPEEIGCVKDEPPKKPRYGTTSWATIRDIAEDAPLKDLMAVYLNRIDEELHSKR